MGKYVVTELTRLMIKRSPLVFGSNILMLGITFKENYTDIRDKLAIDVYKQLKSQAINVDIHDPWADENEVKKYFGFSLSINLNGKKYNRIILTVAHSQYSEIDFRSQLVEDVVLYDVQGILPLNEVDARL
jgi:UDP-N-acetyl-D-galactosamine dehydrogenase